MSFGSMVVIAVFVLFLLMMFLIALILVKFYIKKGLKKIPRRIQRGETICE
jgi:uncharacterized sodium:solute symporter family permease YidK